MNNLNEIKRNKLTWVAQSFCCTSSASSSSIPAPAVQYSCLIISSTALQSVFMNMRYYKYKRHATVNTTLHFRVHPHVKIKPPANAAIFVLSSNVLLNLFSFFVPLFYFLYMFSALAFFLNIAVKKCILVLACSSFHKQYCKGFWYIYPLTVAKTFILSFFSLQEKFCKGLQRLTWPCRKLTMKTTWYLTSVEQLFQFKCNRNT